MSADRLELFERHFRPRHLNAIRLMVDGPQRSNRRIMSWTGLGEGPVRCLRPIAERRPPRTTHDDAVWFLTFLLPLAGEVVRREVSVFRSDGKYHGRADLIAGAGESRRIIEYKHDRLCRSTAQMARDQVLGYREHLGFGEPLVVTMVDGHPVPDVASVTIDEFAEPYLAAVHRQVECVGAAS